MSRQEALTPVVEHTPGRRKRGDRHHRVYRPGTVRHCGPAQPALHGRLDGLRLFSRPGLSLALPGKQVLVADGDGAALMRMGNLATIGAYGGENFRHLLLDNGVHESTGGQSTVSPAVSFAAVAKACGYRDAGEALRRTNLSHSCRHRTGRRCCN